MTNRDSKNNTEIITDGAPPKGSIRMIPVNQSIAITNNVACYEDAVRILKSKDLIVAGVCACRKQAQSMDKGCGSNMDACFMFGTVGQYYLDNNLGRIVSLSEAIDILKKCHEDGLVTQPATSVNPGGMCNCCLDCCGVLAAIRNHPEPASLVFSNHIISTSPKDCVGCKICIKRCQMKALKLDEDETITVSLTRCIGCGLCVTACPTGALTLIDNPEKDRCLPPINTND